MNKFVAVLVVVLALAASQVAAGKGHHHHDEKHKKDSEDCKAETQATDEDVKSTWHFSQDLPTQKAKCYVGCIYEKMEMIVDGAFSKEKAELWIEEMMADHPEEQEMARAEVAKCEAELVGVPHDRCQTGPIVRRCHVRLMKKMHENKKSE